ncbi:HlyD family efflux transporter periplasmic adaptor subunit [Vibrio sp.]|uniref:HlyD family efflux transporter periplasmic adaptor subunit n=1 Tax=Vibrio viridaestus TaxID=2487322 RepID=A0A3N9TEB5_9VIBR|nr:HlyD family efflux transporter periplasmic adaptor subunit [Vibrio viridaestus]MDC0610776.1 HlyD family efflux transporter periplasmic adaptor subunit [Vibrio sp.]RQW62561.1 HlyD family efflux transporter periplasmic adaptor subunit [Vibrio viridaestus]
MNTEDTNEAQFDQTKANKSRKKGFAILALLIILAAGSYTAYWFFYASRYISTDNAYTSTEVAEITPAVSGVIGDVKVVDTQYVKKGDILVTIDDTDARLALVQAEADYALAKRHVQSYEANDEGLNALVKASTEDETRARAQLKSAQATFQRAQIDLKRRQDLVKSGSVSGEEVTNAKTAFIQAQAQLHAAKAAVNQAVANRLSTIGDQKANAVLINNTTVDTNPQVLLAKARFDQAQVDLQRTIIRAPISGVVAKRQVQVGRRVQVGSPLMTVVPLSNMHIDANFKEGELTHVNIGQKVEITSDLYGDDVVYHGVVSGIAGGTGSAFSVIPAQNATGNWIKVVQRLPVRISLDKDELQKHPLQVGLSMEVTIDTSSKVDSDTLARFKSGELPEQG